ncbi:MAG: hypothetical protein QNJ44_09240, partial [Rhodobacter sp.]|nr:hypothetical protein [Rhodobacter sp.]
LTGNESEFTGTVTLPDGTTIDVPASALTSDDAVRAIVAEITPQLWAATGRPSWQRPTLTVTDTGDGTYSVRLHVRSGHPMDRGASATATIQLEGGEPLVDRQIEIDGPDGVYSVTVLDETADGAEEAVVDAILASYPPAGRDEDAQLDYSAPEIASRTVEGETVTVVVRQTRTDLTTNDSTVVEDSYSFSVASAAAPDQDDFSAFIDWEGGEPSTFGGEARTEAAARQAVVDEIVSQLWLGLGQTPSENGTVETVDNGDGRFTVTLTVPGEDGGEDITASASFSLVYGVPPGHGRTLAKHVISTEDTTISPDTPEGAFDIEDDAVLVTEDGHWVMFVNDEQGLVLQHNGVALGPVWSPDVAADRWELTRHGELRGLDADDNVVWSSGTGNPTVDGNFALEIRTDAADRPRLSLIDEDSGTELWTSRDGKLADPDSPFDIRGAGFGFIEGDEAIDSSDPARDGRLGAGEVLVSEDGTFMLYQNTSRRDHSWEVKNLKTGEVVWRASDEFTYESTVGGLLTKKKTFGPRNKMGDIVITDRGLSFEGTQGRNHSIHSSANAGDLMTFTLSDDGHLRFTNITNSEGEGGPSVQWSTDPAPEPVWEVIAGELAKAGFNFLRDRIEEGAEERWAELKSAYQDSPNGFVGMLKAIETIGEWAGEAIIDVGQIMLMFYGPDAAIQALEEIPEVLVQTGVEVEQMVIEHQVISHLTDMVLGDEFDFEEIIDIITGGLSFDQLPQEAQDFLGALGIAPQEGGRQTPGLGDRQKFSAGLDLNFEWLGAVENIIQSLPGSEKLLERIGKYGFNFGSIRLVVHPPVNTGDPEIRVKFRYIKAVGAGESGLNGHVSADGGLISITDLFDIKWSEKADGGWEKGDVTSNYIVGGYIENQDRVSWENFGNLITEGVTNAFRQRANVRGGGFGAGNVPGLQLGNVRTDETIVMEALEKHFSESDSQKGISSLLLDLLTEHDLESVVALEQEMRNAGIADEAITDIKRLAKEEFPDDPDDHAVFRYINKHKDRLERSGHISSDQLETVNTAYSTGHNLTSPNIVRHLLRKAGVAETDIDNYLITQGGRITGITDDGRTKIKDWLTATPFDNIADDGVTYTGPSHRISEEDADTLLDILFQDEAALNMDSFDASSQLILGITRAEVGEGNASMTDYQQLETALTNIGETIIVQAADVIEKGLAFVAAVEGGIQLEAGLAYTDYTSFNLSEMVRAGESIPGFDPAAEISKLMAIHLFARPGGFVATAAAEALLGIAIEDIGVESLVAQTGGIAFQTALVKWMGGQISGLEQENPVNDLVTAGYGMGFWAALEFIAPPMAPFEWVQELGKEFGIHTDASALRFAVQTNIDFPNTGRSYWNAEPFRDLDSSDNLIAENAVAGTYTGITAFSDKTQTYTVSDDRFVIGDDGRVNVANGVTFDAETEPSITLTVTATAQDGTQSTHDFVIKVGDVDEFDVTTPTDTDPANNTMPENAGRDPLAAYTGITVSAIDEDVIDSVSYSIDDDRFEIDDQGRVVVKQGAEFDAETEGTVTVTVTATSTDGSTQSASFDISVSDVNEFDVGPIQDLDPDADIVEPNETYTHIKVSATDQDVSDTVAYSVNDDRFYVDDDGRVVIKDDAVFKPDEVELEITITATSTDGSTSEQAFLLFFEEETDGS